MTITGTRQADGSIKATAIQIGPPAECASALALEAPLEADRGCLPASSGRWWHDALAGPRERL